MVSLRPQFLASGRFQVTVPYMRTRRTRRAFSLIEIAGALSLLALLSLMAIPVFNGTFNTASDTAAATRLSAAQVDGREVIVSSGYTFAADFVTVLAATDPSYVVGDVSGESISVMRVDESRAVYATTSDTGACIYMLDNVASNSPTYASTPAGDPCSAGNVAALLSQITGTRQAPSLLTL